MTLIAGILSRNPEHSIPLSMKGEMRGLISRNPADDVSVRDDSHSYFATVDLGTWKNFQNGSNSSDLVTLTAGEFLLHQNGGDALGQRRDEALLISEGAKTGRLDAVLRKARGVFCAVHYDPVSRVVTLITDKLGVRPLYYWIDNTYVVFANALRILEGLSAVPKTMDLRAVTEMVGFGYPLANRTPYAGIYALRAAEIVEIGEMAIDCRRYWNWSDVSPSTAPREQLLENLHAAFGGAVEIRNRDDHAAIAYLSGGLDSRCVVAALRNAKVCVHTFNFARDRTQDAVFGNEFASQTGTIHEHIPKKAGDLVPDYSAKMSDAWQSSAHRGICPVERPSLVWSGEGGSVALGHVHMNEAIVELMREGRVDEAIETYLQREHITLPQRLLMPDTARLSVGILQDGIRKELDELSSPDPARNFYLFLMFNDQRRKLFAHFENIDLHRLEFQLPFFDSEFLESILAIPVDLCLRHKLYVKWLQYFDSAVTCVPWQAYPEHEPCPIPAPEGLSYQWDSAFQIAERTAKKRVLRSKSQELLAAVDFPDKLLNKRNLRISSWIHATGLRDYEYMIEGAMTYYTYWKRCLGKYVTTGG